MSLLTRILNILGEEGPTTTEPSKYLRHVYNRVMLENATVRYVLQNVSASCAVMYCSARFVAVREIVID